MYKIKISEEVLKHCRNQVEKYNFGNRREANGTQEQQFNGVVGQSVLMQLFNGGLVDGSTGFDNGIDIEFENHKIDIKTMFFENHFGITINREENKIKGIKLEKDLFIPFPGPKPKLKSY